MLGYVVAVDAWRLPREGRLRVAAASDPIAYRVTRLNGARALIEIECEASPDDVLRAFAGSGQPVVGDAHSAAPAATRLMLHVRSASSLSQITAPIPREFETWVSGVPARSAAEFSEALADGALSRYELWPTYEAFFLLSESAGEIAGLSIERYGEYAVVSISSEEAWELRERVAQCLMDHGARGVYVKRRVRADLRGTDVEALAPSAPICGVAAPHVLYVREGHLSFGVELANGLSTGLFLDQRSSWGRLRSSARGARVLNLFCYTGAFSIAAASGGAATTTSVDLSSRALTRLRHNLDLNGLSGPQHRLLASDVPRWLARAGRAGSRFDQIVLDPPSFGTRGRGVLSTQRDYAGLVRSAAELLEKDGSLLCVSHHRKISQKDLAELCARELSGAGAAIEPLVGDWDCPTLPGVSAVQSVLAKRT
jgi:23S rRNA (cytosine1962-C5)-methyltransferase